MPDVFDHVGIRVSDVEASHAFYELAFEQLGYGEPYRDEDFFEWEDLSISQALDDRPVTRNLHLALVASSRDAVERVVAGDDRRRPPERRRAGAEAAVLAELLRRLRPRSR